MSCDSKSLVDAHVDNTIHARLHESKALNKHSPSITALAAKSGGEVARSLPKVFVPYVHELIAQN